MTLVAAVRTHLLADAGFAALAAARLYAAYAPQDYETPCVVMSLESETEEHTISGPVTRTALLSFACIADEYEAAHELAEALRAGLRNYTGTMGGAGGVPVLASLHQDVSDAPEQELGLYVVPVSHQILYLA